MSKLKGCIQFLLGFCRLRRIEVNLTAVLLFNTRELNSDHRIEPDRVFVSPR